jgi:spore germination protein YaaH
LTSPTSPGSSKIEIRWGAIAIAVLVAVAGIIALSVIDLSSDDTPAAPKPSIPLDVWAPYWVLEESVAELPERVGSMREVSPFWFNVTGVGSIEADPNASTELTRDFLETARAAGANLVPSVVDALPPGGMASILASEDRRTRHIDALVAFAENGGYAGLDLDYEQFAFADGRDTWEATRPNWVAFVEELADRLHDDGRTLTVSIPPIYDGEQTATSGFWVYDHGEIIDHVDQIRIMAYDFSVNEPGPISPIDWVESSIAAVVEVTGEPGKIVLGVPAYGRNWPVATTGDCEGLELPGVTTVTNRTVDGLVTRRDATPEYVAETAEWTFEYLLAIGGDQSDCVQTRVVHYVDADGVKARMDVARGYQLSGVSLWAFGFEDAGVWEEILPTVDDGGEEVPVSTTSEEASEE